LLKIFVLLQERGNMKKPHDKASEPTKFETADKLDRQGFFKQIRQDFLVKIGLPEDTKPGQVMKMLEIKKELDKLKKQN
jgi:hypothetical protein